MADAAQATPKIVEQNANHAVEVADGRRNAWILTGYGIFGLAVLSVIAYSVAQYAVR